MTSLTRSWRLFPFLAMAATMATEADDNPITAFNACKKIIDREERLQCFDGLDFTKFEKQLHGSKSAGRQRSADNDFGAGDLAKSKKKSTEDAPRTLTAGLLEVGKTRSGKYLFVLANGQMWRQIQADTSRLLIPKKLDGIKVVIQRRSLGSHTLKLEGKPRSVKVKRIR